MRWIDKNKYKLGAFVVPFILGFLVAFFSSREPKPSEFGFILSLLDVIGVSEPVSWISFFLTLFLTIYFLYAFFRFCESWRYTFFFSLVLLTVPVIFLYTAHLSVEFLFVFSIFFVILSESKFRKQDKLFLLLPALFLSTLILPFGILVSVTLLLYLLLVWIAALRRSEDELYLVFGLSFFVLILTVVFNIDSLRKLGVEAVSGNLPLLIESVFFSELLLTDIMQWVGLPLLLLSLLGLYDSLWSSMRKRSLLYLSALLAVFFFYSWTVLSTQYVIALAVPPLLLLSYTGIKLLESLIGTYVSSAKYVSLSFVTVLFIIGVSSTVFTFLFFEGEERFSEQQIEAFKQAGDLFGSDDIVFAPLRYADGLSYYSDVSVAISSQYTQYTFIDQRYNDLLFLEQERFLTNIIGTLNRYEVTHVFIEEDSRLVEVVEESDCFTLEGVFNSFTAFELRCVLE